MGVTVKAYVIWLKDWKLSVELVIPLRNRNAHSPPSKPPMAPRNMASTSTEVTELAGRGWSGFHRQVLRNQTVGST